MYPEVHAATDPDKPAVIMAATNEVLTYGQLDAEANRVSQVLRGAGLDPGDHVSWCLENRPGFLAVLWGAYYAGLRYTPISSRLTSDEIAYILDNSRARAFISSSRLAERAVESVRGNDRLEVRLMMDEASGLFDSYEQTLAGVSSEPLPQRVTGADMLYSSGTTGRPKGVLTSHTPQSLSESQPPVATLCSLLLGMSAESVYLSPAPLYHAAPLRFVMAAQALGATLVVMERFDPAEFLAAIERYSVTHTQVVPTMFVRMLKLPDSVRSAHDLSSLTHVLHAAAPCPVEAKRQMIDWWGPIIYEYYGGTESNGLVFCDSEQWLAHPGTVGGPLVGEVHIVDESTGTEVPVGDEGVVYFGDGASFEYLGDEQKTRDSRLPNGWSTIGDIGRVDSDGFLYLTDRKAHTIISGGVNVYPQETEDLITMHPAVLDVAVFGVPDDDFGEVVKAVVQPVSMPESDEAVAALERELIDYCRARLASVKCPRSVDFRDELPRHPTGKLYKRLLRDEYWQGREGRI